MARAFFTERWIFARADSGGNPDSTLRIEHRIVDIGLAVPDGFVPPIRRRRRNLVVCARWSLRIANWHSKLIRYSAHWIEDRQIINAEFGSAVDGSIGVQCGIALIRGDLIVQICLRVGPVPLGNDDVPLDTLGSRRDGRQ